MEEISKKERTLRWLKENPDFALSCIHCQKKLHLSDEGLRCEKNHHFDINRQGYLNLLKRPSKQAYSRDLFQARRRLILESNFYESMSKCLAELVEAHSTASPTILDSGSGEGSHLWKILQGTSLKAYRAIAMDITKEAIQQASDYAGYLLPIVGDLSRIPLPNKEVDIILSIFSPSNYDEFERILRPGGKLIKVVPNEAYLIEIRQILSSQHKIAKENYENQAVIDHFARRSKGLSRQRIKETHVLSMDHKRDLVRMTPLTWHLSEEEREALVQKLAENITLDVTILVGGF